MNKADTQRMQAIKDSGCIATLLATGQSQPPDVHHLTSASRRRGHQATIGLSPYHHRGLIPEGHTKQSISGIMGPSYAWGRRGFQAFFGSDELLLEIQNLVLSHFEKHPWYNYEIWGNVRRDAQHKWNEKRH